jgi:hypothetical protein
MLGIGFPAKWREQIALTLENATREITSEVGANGEVAGTGEINSDETFAFLAGRGAPFGVTCEELEQERRIPGAARSPSRSRANPGCVSMSDLTYRFDPYLIGCPA